MERIFVLQQENMKQVFKLNEMLDSGWSVGRIFDWPKAKVFVLFRDALLADDESEGWKDGSGKEDDD